MLKQASNKLKLQAWWKDLYSVYPEGREYYSPCYCSPASCSLQLLWLKRQMLSVNTDSTQQVRQSLSIPKGTLMHRQLQESLELVQCFVWKSSFHNFIISPHHVHIQRCHSNSQNLLPQLPAHIYEAMHNKYNPVKKKKDTCRRT